MIAVDTSALVAILLGEPEAVQFAQAIEGDDEPVTSAASVVELHRVMKAKKGAQSRSITEALLEKSQIQVIAVTPEQAKIACDAGYQYPVLNYGDTFSYALAKHRQIPLLFKGNDFSQTDVLIA